MMRNRRVGELKEVRDLLQRELLWVVFEGPPVNQMDLLAFGGGTLKVARLGARFKETARDRGSLREGGFGEPMRTSRQGLRFDHVKVM